MTEETINDKLMVSSTVHLSVAYSDLHLSISEYISLTLKNSLIIRRGLQRADRACQFEFIKLRESPECVACPLNPMENEQAEEIEVLSAIKGAWRLFCIDNVC